MNEEIWKDVPFDSNYKVSNYGKIFSKRTNKILKGELTEKGYIRVALTEHKRYLVHCIVARTFIPNPENKTQVNHIDGNKQNNYVDNLEWCTQSENMRHALKTGLKIMPKGKDVYNARVVYQYDKNNNLIKRWECMSTASQTLKISQRDIVRVCKGKRKTCGGYIWKYEEE